MNVDRTPRLPLWRLPLALCLAASPVAGAQTWSRTYGSEQSDAAFSVAVDASGSSRVLTLLDGAPAVLHLDRFGNVRSASHLVHDRSSVHAQALAPTGNGDVLLCGGLGNDPWIARLDGVHGVFEWQRVTTTLHSGLYSQVLATADDGVLAVGRSRDHNDDLDLHLVRLHPDGSIRWQVRIGDPDVDEGGHSVVELDDGGVMVAGVIFDRSGDTREDLWLLKFDADGDLLWQRALGTDGSDGRINRPKLCKSATGDVFMTSLLDTLEFGDNDIWLARLDSDGQLLAQIEFDLGLDYPHALHPLPDDGVLLLAETRPHLGKNDAWLAEIGPSLTLEWQVRCGDPTRSEVPRGLGRSSGGEIVLCGRSDNSASEAWVVRLGPAGDMECPCPDLQPGDATTQFRSRLSVVETQRFPDLVPGFGAEGQVRPVFAAYDQDAACGSNSPDWADLGHAKPGARGLPCLTGVGSLNAGDFATTILTAAAPNCPAVLILGLDPLHAPLLGGTLVPAPFRIIPGIPTGPLGRIRLPTVWPSGIPAGLHVYQQYLILDPAAHRGIAFSNAVVGITP